MKLLRIAINNFQGIKKIDMPFIGKDATITAENGSGKTSVYDAFLWLLFGKNSQGKSDFDCRPFDENNVVLSDVIIHVMAEVEIDGMTYKLEKQNKKTSAGYSNSFKIDDVPKKAGEFAEFVRSIAPEETFRLCSNLTYFNELHWTKRREILLEIAGDIQKPQGFETLLAEAGNRSLDEYKKVVRDQVKLKETEKSGITPRIDELTLSINDSSITDGLMTYEQEREHLKSELLCIDSEYERIGKATVRRAVIVEQASKLKNEQTALATRIQSDKSHVADISEQIAGKRQSITAMLTDLKSIEEAGKQIAFNKTTKERELEQLSKEISKLRISRDAVKKAIEELSLETVETKCYACGQLLPQEKFQENIDAKKKRLHAKQQEYTGIVTEGKSLNAKIDTITTEITAITAECDAKREEYKEQLSMYNEVKAMAEEEIKKLEAQIASASTPDFTQNLDWQALDRQIKAIEIPDIESTEPLAKQRSEIQEQLDRCNKALSQSDTIAKNKARIEELQEREKQLAVEITRLNGTLAQIKDYHEQESRLICDAVNGQFEKVTFRLFNTLVNGNTDPCCDTLYNGVPYQGCSTGEKIIIGIDIVKRLASWYNVDIPLFVDNSESLTIPYEYDSQLIKLYAKTGVKKLKLEIQE